MTAGDALNVASGAAFAIVALLVLRLAPRNLANGAFAVLAAGFGMGVMLTYMRRLVGWDLAVVAPWLVAVDVVWAVGLCLLAGAVLRPTSRTRVLTAALLVGAVLWIGYLLATALTLYDPATGAPGSSDLESTSYLVLLGMHWLPLAALLVAGARAAAAGERRGAALMTAALGSYAAFSAGSYAVERVRDDFLGRPDMLAFSAMAALTVSIAVGWLVLLAQRSDAGERRAARWVAHHLLVMMLLGTLNGAFSDAPSRGPAWASLRFLMIALLAYAVVRHQLLGIDVKVRWGLSKATVAAVLITVFFVTSEAAQQFFGDTLGSTYIGIAAAGALVFAMAPLQRAAERLAEKALPVHAPPPMASGPRESYRVLLKRYLGDGRLSREEEIALAHAAAGMGIPGHEALRLRHEVEDEGGRA